MLAFYIIFFYFFVNMKIVRFFSFFILLTGVIRAQGFDPDVAALLEMISRDSLGVTIRNLANAGGHPSRVTFTPGNLWAADHIYLEFLEIGVNSVWRDTFYVPQTETPFDTVALWNVIAEIAGNDSDRTVIVGGHYDCSGSHDPGWSTGWQTASAPGADDNATGVAALLEMARVLSSPENPAQIPYTIWLVAFAAEEYSPAIPDNLPSSQRHHLGSQHFVTELDALGLWPEGVFILDMIGYNPFYDYMEIVSNSSSEWLGSLAGTVNENYGINLIMNEPPFPYMSGSDHQSFYDGGYPAVLFIENDAPWYDDPPYYTANPYYHTAGDSAGTLNLDLVAKTTKVALGAALSIIGDLAPPAQPVLASVTLTQQGHIQVGWQPNQEPDLGGYRLYQSGDGMEWDLLAGEDQLGPGTTGLTFPSPSENPIYFKLTAVDTVTVPNVSPSSDVYGVWGEGTGPVLIVDGFDRWGGSGSWGLPRHAFVLTHAEAVMANGRGFVSCSNDALLEGGISLNGYPAVIWILGDESTVDETFDDQEQDLVENYLENGGCLFVSGSEIGWDLGRTSSSPQDRQFYQNYLKAQYQADDSEDYLVFGTPNSIFNGISFGYGITVSNSPYEEDYPDVIGPSGGSSPCLTYSDGAGAGVQYEGIFGTGTEPGKLVYLAFPFETIHLEHERNLVMGLALDFFGVGTGAEPLASSMIYPQTLRLTQNYPNPFNAATTIRYLVPHPGWVTLKIYNSLGQEIRTLIWEYQPPGERKVVWDGCDNWGFPVPSGVYIGRLGMGNMHLEIKMLVLR